MDTSGKSAGSHGTARQTAPPVPSTDGAVRSWPARPLLPGQCLLDRVPADLTSDRALPRDEVRARKEVDHAAPFTAVVGRPDEGALDRVRPRRRCDTTRRNRVHGHLDVRISIDRDHGVLGIERAVVMPECAGRIQLEGLPGLVVVDVDVQRDLYIAAERARVCGRLREADRAGALPGLRGL